MVGDSRPKDYNNYGKTGKDKTISICKKEVVQDGSINHSSNEDSYMVKTRFKSYAVLVSKLMQ